MAQNITPVSKIERHWVGGTVTTDFIGPLTCSRSSQPASDYTTTLAAIPTVECAPTVARSTGRRIRNHRYGCKPRRRAPSKLSFSSTTAGINAKSARRQAGQQFQTNQGGTGRRDTSRLPLRRMLAVAADRQNRILLKVPDRQQTGQSGLGTPFDDGRFSVCLRAIPMPLLQQMKAASVTFGQRRKAMDPIATIGVKDTPKVD
jgi:hypothetical protein